MYSTCQTAQPIPSALCVENQNQKPVYKPVINCFQITAFCRQNVKMRLVNLLGALLIYQASTVGQKLAFIPKTLIKLARNVYNCMANWNVQVITTHNQQTNQCRPCIDFSLFLPWHIVHCIYASKLWIESKLGSSAHIGIITYQNAEHISGIILR